MNGQKNKLNVWCPSCALAQAFALPVLVLKYLGTKLTGVNLRVSDVRF